MSEEKQLEREDELQQQIQNARIAQIAARVPTGLGEQNCHSCDEEIPLARRQLGFSNCVFCAEARESHNRIFGRV